MRSKSGAAAREYEFTSIWFVSALVVIGVVIWAMTPAFAAVGAAPGPGFTEHDADDVITGSVPDGVGYSTNVRMQFFQEDGARAGHVKVVLTPDDRPLSMDEARSAARQAFLETLNDPVFTDGLKIVTVVVHRFPGEDELGLDFEVSVPRPGRQHLVGSAHRVIAGQLNGFNRKRLGILHAGPYPLPALIPECRDRAGWSHHDRECRKARYRNNDQGRDRHSG